MLSQDLARYVDLHQLLGFKFRTQRLLLHNFVALPSTPATLGCMPRAH